MQRNFQQKGIKDKMHQITINTASALFGTWHSSVTLWTLYKRHRRHGTQWKGWEKEGKKSFYCFFLLQWTLCGWRINQMCKFSSTQSYLNEKHELSLLDRNVITIWKYFCEFWFYIETTFLVLLYLLNSIIGRIPFVFLNWFEFWN